MHSPDERWLLEEKYGGIESPEFLADKKRLEEGEPVAYLIGSQPFLGLRIFLDSKPLIPRPETEWWTEQLLRETTGEKVGEHFSFLDLCAGSGAIGCAALAKLPGAQVYFGEIDPAHESTIRRNIRENGLDMSRAHIRIGDLFEPFGDMTFDLIAINPPYIPSSRPIEHSVAKYEPSLALFSGDDGLELMRRIAKDLPLRLTKSGRAWIECDSAHVEAAQEFFLKQNLAAHIRTDQYGVPRILVVSFT